MNLSRRWTHFNNASAIHISPKGTVLVVVESLIFLVLNIAALVGNLLVCMAFYRNPSLRTVTNNFILSLAFTDLLVAVFVMPVFTASSFANRWIAGDIGLNLALNIRHIAAATSLLTVMLLAINRYFRVVRPEWYRKIYSKKSSSVMAATSWIVTALWLLIGTFSLGIKFKISEYNPTSPYIAIPNRLVAYIYTHMFFNVYFITPSVVIALCYVKIYQTIRQHNMAAAPSSQEGNSAYGVEEARMTKLLTVVVVGFYICWIPVFVTNILVVTKFLKPESERYSNFYAEFPLYASSVINPMVYGVMNASFRSEFLRIIRCRGDSVQRV